MRPAVADLAVSEPEVEEENPSEGPGPDAQLEEERSTRTMDHWLPASDAVEGYQMSPQQERLLQQQASAPAAFLASLAVKVSGPVTLSDFLEALAEVTVSQEALRTLFLPSTESGRLVQVVAGPAPAVRVVDLRHLAPGDRRRVAEEGVSTEGRRRFDLARGPSLRVLLFRLEAEEILALFQLPSLCADASSLNQLFDQITAAYASRRPLKPHERPMPYTQFAAWQRQLLELPEAEEERLVWRALDLTGTFPRQLPLLPEAAPEGFFSEPYRPQKVSRTLGGEALERLCRGAEELGVSLEVLLLSAWALVLWRSAEAVPRLALLKSADGRGGYEELRATLGLFEKFLPLVVGVESERGFTHLVRQVARRLEEGEAEQEYFDGRFLNSWEVEYPAEGLPVGFSFEPLEEPRKVGEVRFSIAGLGSLTERFAVRLACQARRNFLRLTLVFDRSLYRRRLAELLLGRFETALGQALADPRRPLADLPLLSLEERRQLLFELNNRAPGADPSQRLRPVHR
ncbi:MAG: hypothetical protein KDD47_18090, partial [Acidobacteria bacterium]|nr:hypothetical protein [Acidobacteriota bacterium]